MIATVIETKDMLETVAASLIAGVGVTTVFALLVFGTIRSAEMVRDERPLLATAAGGLAVLALLVVIASIVLGIVVMTSK
jgi:cytochrome c biogenesis protein CcdA